MQTLGVAFVDSSAHSVAAVLVMVERKAILDDTLGKKRRRGIRNYLTKFKDGGMSVVKPTQEQTVASRT